MSFYSVSAKLEFILSHKFLNTFPVISIVSGPWDYITLLVISGTIVSHLLIDFCLNK